MSLTRNPTGQECAELLVFLPLLGPDADVYRPAPPAGTEAPQLEVAQPGYRKELVDFIRLASADCWTDRDYAVNMRETLRTPSGLAEASLSDLRTLLTWLSRGERFCNGTWGEAVRSGLVQALLQRLQILCREADQLDLDAPALSWWSWADIVRRADRLGIPNFQRGAVWDMGNRTALLESIYEKSPCGSFVLWEPEEDIAAERRGVALLGKFAPEVKPLWLVDGQQRSRTMLSVFQEMLHVPEKDGWSAVRTEDLDALRNYWPTSLQLASTAQPEDEGKPDEAGQNAQEGDGAEAVGDDNFWVVVLPAMRQFERGDGSSLFGKHSESRRVVRASMFRRFGARARTYLDSAGKEKVTPPAPYGCIPLAALASPQSIFLQPSLCKEAWAALQSFIDDTPDCERLNGLLPWGAFFVSGYWYERQTRDGKVEKPLQWADLWEQRDAAVMERVKQLQELFHWKWRKAVFEGFHDMLLGPRFAVGWLPSRDVSAAIEAYVRINRAGIRVRQDERALALLSRARPQLLDDLARYIQERDKAAGVDPRSLLSHERNRQMGFTIWMPTVTRYCALALLGTEAARWLETEAIDKKTFEYRLDRVGPHETETGRKVWADEFKDANDLVERCAGKASAALRLIDSVLSKELWFDHRMARPQVWGLRAVRDLFYRVPESAFRTLDEDHDFRAAFARLMHWALLAPYMDQSSLEHLILQVHELTEKPASAQPVTEWKEDWKDQLRAAMGRLQDVLKSHWQGKLGATKSDDLDALALKTFRLEVEQATLLRHSAVGWLYAIERRNQAKEFCWQVQYDGFDQSRRSGIQKNGTDQEESPLDAKAIPEKQHIVPFSSARLIVGGSPTRQGSSAVNSVGNLTWLSQRQNGFFGLADNWAVLDENKEAANLRAHGMLATTEHGGDTYRALDLYRQMQERQSELACLKAEFDAFCQARRQWLVEEMGRWLEEELSPAACEWLGRSHPQTGKTAMRTRTESGG